MRDGKAYLVWRLDAIPVPKQSPRWRLRRSLRVQCPFDDGQPERIEGVCWRAGRGQTVASICCDVGSQVGPGLAGPRVDFMQDTISIYGREVGPFVFPFFLRDGQRSFSTGDPPLLWWIATRRLSHDFWNKRWTRPHGKRSILVSRGGTFRFRSSRGHERVGAQRKIKRNKG